LRSLDLLRGATNIDETLVAAHVLIAGNLHESTSAGLQCSVEKSIVSYSSRLLLDE